MAGEDGKPTVDPDKRLKYGGLATNAVDDFEEELGRHLTAREHLYITNALRAAPINDKAKLRAWSEQLRRTIVGDKQAAKTQGGLDTPRPEPRPNAAPLGTSKGGAPANPHPGGLAERRTPQQEQIHQARFNPMDQLRLKELHHEVTASNLTQDDRAKLEAEIQSIMARNA